MHKCNEYTSSKKKKNPNLISVLNIFNGIYPYNNNILTQNLFEKVAYRLVH